MSAETSPWFIRMQYRTGGPGYTAEMWAEYRIGVMFGPWRCADVMTHGIPDPAKLTLKHFQHYPNMPQLTKRQWETPRRFFLDMKPGDTVVSMFNQVVYVGEVGSGFEDHPVPQPNETFKCRPVVNKREFQASDLPAVYRLLPIVQGTLHRIKAFARR